MNDAMEFLVTPLISAQKKIAKREEFPAQNIYKAQVAVSYIITMFIVALAASLSWQCHTGYCMAGRILHLLVATLFSVWYLIFYLVYRVLLNNKCKK